MLRIEVLPAIAGKNGAIHFRVQLAQACDIGVGAGRKLENFKILIALKSAKKAG